MERAHYYPVLKKKSGRPDLEKCATLLKENYHSVGNTEYGAHSRISEFTVEEVKHAVRKLKKKKCGDMQGILAEMFHYCGFAFYSTFAKLVNDIVHTGKVPDSWYVTHFQFLHEGSDTNDANNWRPVAILCLTYKLLARLIYDRISKRLEEQQSEDQFGFPPKRSTSHALLILESMISNEIKFNAPVWIISLDLRKAFDRIEHYALFEALRHQRLSEQYINLLQILYSGQYGQVGDYLFDICRGVRQGDILSPILFNAGLEQALREWKSTLTSEGFILDDFHWPFTNLPVVHRHPVIRRIIFLCRRSRFCR